MIVGLDERLGRRESSAETARLALTARSVDEATPLRSPAPLRPTTRLAAPGDVRGAVARLARLAPTERRRKLSLRSMRRSLRWTLIVVVVATIAWRWKGHESHEAPRKRRRTVVWGSADAELRSVVLPHVAGQEPLAITLLSSAIRTQHATYRDSGPEHFVQVLAAMRELDPPVRLDIWQTFTRNASAVIDRLTCELSRSNGHRWTVPGSYRTPWMYDLDLDRPERKSGMALLLHCPLPGFVPTAHAKPDSRLRVHVKLHLHGRGQAFVLPEIVLQPYRPPPPTMVGMCTAPLFGEYKGLCRGSGRG